MTEDVWENYNPIYQNQSGEIFDQPWYPDLVNSVLKGENVEDFIAAKEEKRLSSFLANDPKLTSYNQELSDLTKNQLQKSKETEDIKRFYKNMEDLNQKISDVISTFPPSKQKQIKSLLSQYQTTGKFSPEAVEQIQQANGLIDRLRNGKKYQEGGQKLQNLMSSCETYKREFAEYGPSSYNYEQHFSDVLKQTNLDRHKSRCLSVINQNQTDISSGKINIDNCLLRIQRRKEEFPQANTENQIIRDFVTENKERITSPQTMGINEIKEKGLSQEYVEGMILNSKSPREAYRSIRQFYDGLKDPVAPRVAFNGRANRGKDVDPAAMVEKLREKGLNAVLASDPRAIDPKYFAVNENSIFAPFLSPQEALKANITMVEAMTELGCTPSLSNPQSRESMVPAIERTGQASEKLDNYQINSMVNKEGIESIVTRTTNDWNQNNSNALHFDSMINDIKKDNPELYGQISGYIAQNRSRYALVGADGRPDLNQKEAFVKDIFAQHKQELEPYFYKEYQKDMLKDAFEKGINPVEIDKQAKEAIVQNGYPTSVFHGGQQGTKPYSILCRESEGNMAFVYGAVTVTPNMENAHMGINGGGALGYAFNKSSHNVRQNGAGNYEFGFLYEYESRGKKQEMTLLDMAHHYDGGQFDKSKITEVSDETAILPHQNKLKKVYIAVKQQGEIKLLPLEVDANGDIKDKKWKEFAELYNPIDDNMHGNMVNRRNNMITDYDGHGKDNMYRKIEPLEGGLKQGYTPQTETLTQSASEIGQKTAVKAGEKEIGKAAQIINGASALNNKIDKAIDKTIESGSSALNNSSVGKAYNHVARQISKSKIVETLNKGTSKVATKIANTSAGKAVSKSVGKIVTKTAGTAIGKSIIKKIPVVSFGAGCYFAYQRLKDGDWKGACGELTSGTLGCFPGLGTAASVAVDAGLAARDINTAVKAQKTVQYQTPQNKENLAQTRELIAQKRGTSRHSEQTEIKKTQLSHSLIRQNANGYDK